jgi:hypothetical protein
LTSANGDCQTRDLGGSCSLEIEKGSQKVFSVTLAM